MKLFSVLFVMTAAVSCSKKQDHLSIVPNDVDLFVSIDQTSLLKKSGVKDNKEINFDEILEDMESDLSPATFQLLEKIILNPNESGIDFEEPTSVFIDLSISEDPYIIMKMDDKSKFTSMIELLNKEENLGTTINNAASYDYFYYDEEVLLAYNENVMLLSTLSKGMDKSKASIDNLFSAENKKTILDVPAYNNLAAMRGDIKLLVNNGSIQNLNLDDVQAIYSMLEMEMVDMVDVYSLCALSFNNGNIKLDMKIHSDNEKYNSMIKEYEAMCPNLSSDVLSMFPASTLGLYSFGLSGKEVLKNEQIEELMAMYSSQNEVKDMIISTLGSIDGDFSLAMLGVSNEIPEVLVYSEVKNADFLAKMLTHPIFQMIAPTKVEENKYVIDLSQMMPGVAIYFGIEADLFYLTNSSSAYENIGNEYPESLNDNDLAINPYDNMMYFMADANNAMNNDFLKQMINEEVELEQVMNMLSTLELGVNIGDGVMILTLKDDSKNSLQQIIDFAAPMIVSQIAN